MVHKKRDHKYMITTIQNNKRGFQLQYNNISLKCFPTWCFKTKSLVGEVSNPFSKLNLYK